MLSPAPIAGPGDSTAVLSYTWNKPGSKTIIVIASNGVNTVNATHKVEITGGSSSGNGVKVYLPTVMR